MEIIKTLLSFLLLLTVSLAATAQVPSQFNYQAVLRDNAGQVMENVPVEIEIAILQASADGQVVFSETHQVQTNTMGLVNLQIGSVNNLNDIDWGNDSYFLRLSIDGELMGVSQLLSVPFALYASSSADSFSGDYEDLENVPGLEGYISIAQPTSGDILYFDQQQWHTLPAGEEGTVLMVVGGMPQWADIPGNGNGGDDDDENTVTDADGNVYPVVTIGKQRWMAASLRTTSYNDGSTILTGLDNDTWNGTPDGAYAVYPHDDIYGIDSPQQMQQAYGNLYNWNAVNDERGICPAGWRVPSRTDWEVLMDSIMFYHDHVNVDNIGNTLKSCRQVNSPLGEECATEKHPRWDAHFVQYGWNEFGFDGLPSGFRGWNGNYSSIGVSSTFWTSTEGSATSAWTFRLMYGNGFGEIQNLTKKTGYPIRCVKDN